MIKSATQAPSTPTRMVLEPENRMILPPQPSRMESYRSPRDFERLKYEQARLDTYALPPGWPVSFIQAKDCAASGFFFLQEGDKVQCAFCRGVAGEWEQGDNPASEHRRHFPLCPFVCGLPVGNIRIGEEQQAAEIRATEEPQGIDVCGPFESFPRTVSVVSYPQDAGSARGAQPLNGDMNNTTNGATGLGIQVCGNGAVYKDYVTLQARLKTFSNWPKATGQAVETLADAGFFYIGKLDHVKCFYCDGGLRNWEPADDPWLEHARWFPNCSYVILHKGEDFVKQITEAKPPVVPEEQCVNNLPPGGHTNSHRRVSDQELRDLIDTPVVQAALAVGMEISRVKGALLRKIQQTGVPFHSTESLVGSILEGLDEEYVSGEDTESDEDNYEYEPQIRHGPMNALNIPMFSGSGSIGTSESSSGSSAEHSSGSGDEETPSLDLPPVTVTQKTPASRTASGDSGVSTVSSMSGEVENSSSEERQSENEPTSTPSNPGISSGSSENRIPSVDTIKGEGEAAVNISSDKNACMGGASKVAESESELKEELRQLRERTQCKICMDNKLEIVFLPCGHLVSCIRCSTALSTCAVCRQPIKAYVKTYLS